jgi:hypothetical protein
MSANPYLDLDGWYWEDANRYRHGPHEHETAALRSMLEHIEQQRKWREDGNSRRAHQSDRKKPPS